MKSRLKCVKGIVDCHTHSGAIDINNYYHMKYPAMNDVMNLNNLLIDNNVDYAITFPMPSTIYYNVKRYWAERVFVESGMSDFPFAIENSYLLVEISFWNCDNILPFLSFSLNDKIKEQLIYLETTFEKYNYYGLKYHSKVDQNAFESLLKKGRSFLDFLIEKNIPLIFHVETSGISSPMGVFSLANLYPQLRISLAHYAGMNKEFFREYDDYLKSNCNIFFDTAPSLCMCRRYLSIYPNESIISLDYSRPDKVNEYFLGKYVNTILWGTDAPWLFSADLYNNENIEHISYIEEMALYKELRKRGYCYKESVANRFLFGE